MFIDHFADSIRQCSNLIIAQCVEERTGATGGNRNCLLRCFGGDFFQEHVHIRETVPSNIDNEEEPTKVQEATKETCHRSGAVPSIHLVKIRDDQIEFLFRSERFLLFGHGAIIPLLAVSAKRNREAEK